jgi:hypothetical protein
LGTAYAATNDQAAGVGGMAMVAKSIHHYFFSEAARQNF